MLTTMKDDGFKFQIGLSPEQREAYTEKQLHSIDGPVRTWSESTLQDFEACPHRVYLSKVEKLERKQHPAAARGDAIHKAAEDLVRGDIEKFPGELTPKDYPTFEARFEELQEAHADGRVELEGEWGFTHEWGQCDFQAPDVWGRMKLDVFVRESDSSALVIDHKTGRVDGNEVKHGSQRITYALGVMMRHPEIEFVKAEFWYLDKGVIVPATFTRADVPILLPALTRRALKLTTCVVFHPRPTAYKCKFCPFGKTHGTGACEYAAA